MSTRPEITSPTEFLGTTVEELESRLATNALYDEDNKRLLEELLTENEELRKGNMTLEMENRRLQHALELDARRYRESVGAGDSDSRWDMYDWIANIDLLSDVSKEGWRIEFSEAFLRGLDDATQEHLLSGRPWSTPDGKGKPPPMGWQGAVVAVLGLYDKGKTFVLNHLTESKLPSGKKVSTKGLSFKHVMIDGGTRFILLDSEGSYSPVRVVDELSVVEKETTELFLQELIFEMSDYFLCVVNDFTSLDQRYLDKLTRNLQNSTKAFREVIVVHNCKEVIDDATLRHVWETQVTAIYGSGTMQHTKVAAIDAMTETLVEKTVAWFKTPFSRHVLLANHDSELGELLNPWAFSLLRYWLKSVFVPVNREFAVVDTVVHYSNIKLANHFKSHPQLQLVQTDQPHLAYIRSCSEVREQLRLQQISVDASGIMLARPDNYLPPVDIIKEVDGTYCIYMDVPGMTRAQIKLSRQNVVTIIKGTREPDFTERELATAVTRQERKHGDFTMTFRIPEEYGPAGRAHVPAHHPRSLSQNRAPRYPLQVSTPLVERHRRERRALRLVPQGRRRGPLGRGGHLRIARSLVSARKKGSQLTSRPPPRRRHVDGRRLHLHLHVGARRRRGTRRAHALFPRADVVVGGGRRRHRRRLHQRPVLDVAVALEHRGRRPPRRARRQKLPRKRRLAEQLGDRLEDGVRRVGGVRAADERGRRRAKVREEEMGVGGEHRRRLPPLGVAPRVRLMRRLQPESAVLAAVPNE